MIEVGIIVFCFGAGLVCRKWRGVVPCGSSFSSRDIGRRRAGRGSVREVVRSGCTFGRFESFFFHLAVPRSADRCRARDCEGRGVSSDAMLGSVSARANRLCIWMSKHDAVLIPGDD